MNHCPDVYINRALKGKSVVLTGFEDVARSDCMHHAPLTVEGGKKRVMSRIGKTMVSLLDFSKY